MLRKKKNTQKPLKGSSREVTSQVIYDWTANTWKPPFIPGCRMMSCSVLDFTQTRTATQPKIMTTRPVKLVKHVSLNHESKAPQDITNYTGKDRSIDDARSRARSVGWTLWPVFSRISRHQSNTKSMPGISLRTTRWWTTDLEVMDCLRDQVHCNAEKGRSFFGLLILNPDNTELPAYPRMIYKKSLMFHRQSL